MPIIRYIAILCLLLNASLAWAPPFGRPAYHPPAYHPKPDYRPHDYFKPEQGDKPQYNNEELQKRFEEILGKKPEEDKQEKTNEEVAAQGVTAATIDATKDDGHYSKLMVTVASGGLTTKKLIDVPQWEFFKLEKAIVQQRMAKAFDRISGDEPVFFTDLPSSLSTSDLLPGRVTVRTFDNSARFVSDHINNLDKLSGYKISIENTKFFNFLTPSTSMGNRTTSRWNKLRNIFNSTASKLGLTSGSSKEELINALNEGNTDVIVVVAHGDKSSIYLPDGSSLTVEDVLRLPSIKNDRAPVVILLSCETGDSRGAGTITIAEALMLRGRATAIIAPTRPVPADSRTANILDKFFSSAQKGRVTDFMKELRGPWQVIVEYLHERQNVAG